jgi:hypothetical protein
MDPMPLPGLLWYQLLIVLVAAGSVVIAATGLFLTLFEIRTLRAHINSRMDQLLDIATTAAYARGQRAVHGAPDVRPPAPEVPHG